ncbi:hypothetical protein HDV00_004010 [Rhizophlyctis rosea]|nr:hypothetical protein HDV00_004010 [Rhizophlyctis rosea]
MPPNSHDQTPLPPASHWSAEEMSDPTKVRVAVIGSGLAGLSTAYLLASTNVDGECPFEVHLYEKSASLGMDSASIPVPCFCRKCKKDGGEDVEHIEGRMDVPMRSFFPEYYTMLTGLYESLKIPYATSTNSISFSTLSHSPSHKHIIPSSFPHTSHTPSDKDHSNDNQPTQTPYFSFSTYSVPLFNVDISLPDFLHRPATLFRSALVSKDYLRLLVLAKSYAAAGQLLTFEKGQIREDSPLYGWTMGDFLRRKGFGKEFAREAFAPLFSGVCTCSFDSLMEFPAAVILEYVARNMPFGKMSFVSSSIQAVCTALSAPIHSIFLSTGVRSIHSVPTSSKPQPTSSHRQTDELAIETDNGHTRHYDYVVFATQANQAARILRASRFADGDGAVQSQASVLERFPYLKSLVVCHTDEEVMPKERERWRCLNFATVEGNGWVGEGAKNALTNGVNGRAEEGGYDPTNVSQCTHFFNLTLPQLGTTKAYLQTTNPITLPSADKTLSASWFERATVTWDSMLAVDDLGGVQGLGGRWFVGSYAWPGIPLLEGCVASGAAVVKEIGGIEGVEITLPWEGKNKEKEEDGAGPWEKVWDRVLLFIWMILAWIAELRLFRSNFDSRSMQVDKKRA